MSEAPPEPFRRRFRAGVLRGFTGAAGLLPEPVWTTAFAPLAAWAGRSSHGRRTRANLELALGKELGPQERERVARAVFVHARRQFAEWLRLAHGAAPDNARGAWIEERVHLDGSVDRLREQLATGRGALIATAHHGNWELLAAALRRCGFGGAVVGQKRARDSTRDWLVDMRTAYGVETLPQDSSPRHMIEVLRSGKILGVLPDLEVRRLDGVFLPFFGVPALTMTAPAALARTAKVPLFPVRCVREGESLEERLAQKRYVLRVDEPIEYDRARKGEEATRVFLEQLGARFEGWIREAPEQWSWHQPRWRTRPGEHAAVPITARR